MKQVNLTFQGQHYGRAEARSLKITHDDNLSEEITQVIGTD